MDSAPSALETRQRWGRGRESRTYLCPTLTTLTLFRPNSEGPLAVQPLPPRPRCELQVGEPEEVRQPLPGLRGDLHDGDRAQLPLPFLYQLGRDEVALVEDEYGLRGLHHQLRQGLRRALVASDELLRGLADVEEEKDYARVGDLLQSRLEGLDEVGGEVADEPDRVREQGLPLPDHHRPGGGRERREDPRVDALRLPREEVEEAGLPRRGVTREGYGREGELPPVLPEYFPPLR